MCYRSTSLTLSSARCDNSVSIRPILFSKCEIAYTFCYWNAGGEDEEALYTIHHCLIAYSARPKCVSRLGVGCCLASIPKQVSHSCHTFTTLHASHLLSGRQHPKLSHTHNGLHLPRLRSFYVSLSYVLNLKMHMLPHNSV